MDEIFNDAEHNRVCENVEEETMKEKTFFDKAFDFVKNHKLEIAAGIGLAYLGYKFGAKKSYNTGYIQGYDFGQNEMQDRWVNYMTGLFPKENVAYETYIKMLPDTNSVSICSTEITPATIAELKALVKDLDLK